MFDFAVTFKAALDRADLTPSEFARTAGVRKSFVSMVLSAKKKPPLDRLDAWADVLRLTGEQREAFLDAGSLLACPERIRLRMIKLAEMVGEQSRPRPRRGHKPS